MRRYFFEGKPYEVSGEGKKSKVITWKDPGGVEIPKSFFDSHSRRKVKQIIFHWGGDDPENLADILMDNRRSSHISIDGDEIYQHGDFEWMGAHSKPGNLFSIGVDINQESRRPEVHRKRGKVVEVVPNNILELDQRPEWEKAVEKYPEILTIDPVTARTAREFMLDMNEMFGIPIEVPRNPDGSYRYSLLTEEERLNFEGSLGHHHMKDRKWDIAPWWKDVMDPVFEPQGFFGGILSKLGGSAGSWGSGGSQEAAEGEGDGVQWPKVVAGVAGAGLLLFVGYKIIRR